LEKEKFIHSSADGKDTFIRLENKIIPVCYLDSNQEIENSPASLIIILDNGNGNLRALVVDELLGQQEAIVYPLQGILAEVKNSSGCALLGNGEIGMILSLDTVQFT
jgi:two-component system chemotaxis sensor kinase CheA